MKFNDYQKRAILFAKYPEIGEHFMYPVLGLCGEAGEVAEKVKKLFRDNGGHITDDFVDSLTKELGDVLWYVSAIAYEFGLTLDEVADKNIDKLSCREKRGKINGSGDER